MSYLVFIAELTGFSSLTEKNVKSLSCELTGYISSSDAAIIEWYQDDSRIEKISNHTYFIFVSKANTSQLINSQGMIVQNIISTLYIYISDVAGDYKCVVFDDDDLLYVNFTIHNDG